MNDTAPWARHPHSPSAPEVGAVAWRRMHQATDGSLVLCAWDRDARRATAARWGGSGWDHLRDLREPLPLDAALPVQDLRVDNDALWLLDGAGALWRGGDSWERVAAPHGGPGRSGYSDRRMAWHEGRLVVHGGFVENATWCFDPREGRWRELRSHPRPRHGAGALVSTPSGLHLFVFDELWRLDGDRWVCVATLPRDLADDLARSHWLLWVAARDAWLTLLPERAAQPFTRWTADGWERLDLAPPASVRGRAALGVLDDDHSGEPEVLVGFDARAEVLVVCDREATFTHDLARVAWSGGGLPSAEVPRRNDILPAPTRANALALRVTDEDVELTDAEWALLPEALRPPFAHEHRPWLIVPLPDALVAEGLPVALVVGSTLHGGASDLDSLVAPDERSEHVVVAALAAWTRDDAVSFDVSWDVRGDRWSYRARRVVLEPFVDIAPRDTLRFDSPPGRAIHLREEDKVGGDASVSVGDAPTDPVTLQLRALCSVGDNDQLAIWVFVEGGSLTPPSLLGISRVL